MCEAELLEERSDITLAIVDTETVGDDALEIDTAPAHGVLPRSEADLDDLRQFGHLFSRQARATPPFRLSCKRSGPAALKRWTRSRSVWQSIPPMVAASARLLPSRTAAATAIAGSDWHLLGLLAKRRSSVAAVPISLVLAWRRSSRAKGISAAAGIIRPGECGQRGMKFMRSALTRFRHCSSGAGEA